MNLAEAEKLIEASPDHRLLRRVPAPERWNLAPVDGELRRGVLVDCETTGLDPDRDEVIELALAPFDYERESGRIVKVDVAAALSELREPSFPVPAVSTRVHGLTPDMVRGRAVDAEHIRAVIEPAQLVILTTQPSTG
jgi:DNA polymerase III subunit epsilon